MAERSSGWLLVTGLFLIMTVSSGFGFYCLSVFMNALAAEKGFALSAISGAIGLVFVVGGFAGLVVARLIERFDPRYVICGGALIGGAALTLVGRVDEVWQLYLVYALYGIGNSGVSLIPGTVLITRRFSGTRRSVAMALATQGLSAGGVVITPFAALLIETSGLAGAMPLIGLVFFLGIAPVAWLTVRPMPVEFGSAAVDGTGSLPPSRGWEYGAAIRSRFFVLLTSAYVLIMLAQVGAITHQFTLISGRVDAAIAAGSVSLLAMSSVIGRFLGGWMLTWMAARKLTLGNLVLQTIGLGCLSVADGAATLLFASAVFGFSVGNLLMLQPLLLAEAFGVRDYGRIYSLSMLLTMIGVAGGPVVLGMLHDLTGGYLLSFLMAAFVSVLAYGALISSGPVPDGEALQVG